MYAIGLVSLMQQFNIATILFFAYTFFDIDVHVNKYIIYASFLTFIIPNYIRYTRIKSYKQMDERWGNDTRKKKVLGGIVVVSYIALTTIVFIATAHMLGKIKRGEL
jgi:magnesium-transporting ATPase (P-type)